LHSLFSGKDRDLKIQRQRVLYRGLTYKQRIAINLLDLYSDSIFIQVLYRELTKIYKGMLFLRWTFQRRMS